MTLKEEIAACMSIAKQGLEQARKEKTLDKVASNDQITQIAGILLSIRLKGRIFLDKDLIEQSKSTG